MRVVSHSLISKVLRLVKIRKHLSSRLRIIYQEVQGQRVMRNETAQRVTTLTSEECEVFETEAYAPQLIKVTLIILDTITQTK